MEYSVGSISDLISGKTTASNPKVIKKEFKLTPKKNTKGNVNVSSDDFISLNINSDNVASSEGKQIKKPKLKIKKNVSKKTFVQKDTLENDSNNDITANEIKIVKSKKRKSKVESTVIEEKIEKKAKKHKLKQQNATVEDDVNEEVAGDETDPTESKKRKIVHNAQKRIKAKETKEKLDEKTEETHPMYMDKTIFVGNVDVKVNKKKLTKLFAKYGTVETVRFRCIPLADSRTPKKTAMIKKEFHANRSTYNAYVRFEKREDALKAVQENGKEFHDRHIRVNMCDSSNNPDEKKAIFVGNICFDAEEEDLWKLFEPCGEIESVRLIRDRRTNVGKGFGYINFVSSDSAELALQMEPVKMKNRELRVSECNINTAKKLKKKNKVTRANSQGKRRREKAQKEGDGESKYMKPAGESKSEFQGFKFTEKQKKKTPNKGLLKKKKMIKKIAPNPTT